MATIWKGSLTFGLVNIPIELKTAIRANHISFRLLHKSDRSPVKYQRFSSKGDGPLAWDEIVKGYEYTKGKYVVVTEEDFRSAALASSDTIDILDFVKQDEIDPRYFETPYYLVPTKGGNKSYALLREALRHNSVVGIGKIVMHQTQHLVSVKSIGDALVLEIMRFADELVDSSEYRFPNTSGVKAQELKMAEQLVQNLAADFNPEKYTDEYRANLMRIIKAKMKGKKVPKTAPTRDSEADNQVIDLMDRLKASLDRTSAKRQKDRPARTKPALRTRKSA